MSSFNIPYYPTVSGNPSYITPKIHTNCNNFQIDDILYGEPSYFELVDTSCKSGKSKWCQFDKILYALQNKRKFPIKTCMLTANSDLICSNPTYQLTNI